MEIEEINIAIVGGGIAGLTTAVALQRLGEKSLVLESSESLRVSGYSFVTWDNAWRALDAVGVADSLRVKHCRLEGLVVSKTQTWSNPIISKVGDHEVRCLERKVLLETLANELPNETIRFSSKVVSIEDSGAYFKLIHLADGSTIKTKVLIGCDGVNSVVGRWLGLQIPPPSARSVFRGHVNYNRNHGFEPKFFQFLGKGIRYGIVPIDNNSVYWFFFFNPSICKGDELVFKDNPLKMKQFVLENLGNVSEQVKGVIRNTEMENFTFAPLRHRSIWQVLRGEMVKGNVCVVGDAFHPMTPDIGEGACSTLEDAVILARCLAGALRLRGHPKASGSEDLSQRSGGGEGDLKEEFERIEMGLKQYAKERRWRVTSLTATSFFVGLICLGLWRVVRLFRDKVFSPNYNILMLKMGDFDCGKLDYNNQFSLTCKLDTASREGNGKHQLALTSPLLAFDVG